ncbi:MAG: DUF2269 family protein [Acidimicrobiales bacterium]
MAGTFVLAVVGDDSALYRLVFLIHVLTVIVGFGSSFVYPVLGREAQARRGAEAKALVESSMKATAILTTPWIYAAGVSGFVLVLMSDLIDFKEAWISIALGLFTVAVTFAAAVHLPNLRRMNALVAELAAAPPGGGGGRPPQADELEQRGQRAAMYGGIFHLMFLALLVDMIWKPGSLFT